MVFGNDESHVSYSIKFLSSRDPLVIENVHCRVQSTTMLHHLSPFDNSFSDKLRAAHRSAIIITQFDNVSIQRNNISRFSCKTSIPSNGSLTRFIVPDIELPHEAGFISNQKVAGFSRISYVAVVPMDTKCLAGQYST